jgi:hypothetical protein
MVGRNPAELRALRLALNRVAEETVWNKDALRSEMRELVNLSFDIDLTGFDAIEIDHILEIDPPQAIEATGVSPALQHTAVSVPGDIWLCGRHRVGCGEARDAVFAQRVGGSNAVMAFIDPFGDSTIGDLLTTKGRAQQHALQPSELLTQSLTVLKALCTTDALLYACTDWPHIADLFAAAKICELPLMDLCVWGKAEAVPGSLYRSQYELVCIFRANAGDHAHNVELGRHGRNRSNLWTYRGTASKSDESPTGPRGVAKPVTLVADAIRDATKRGAVIVDTFLGSGTTLIAAQETGRVCVGIERDPRYVDLSIRRWQNATQQQALHAERRETFDHCGHRVAGLRQEVSRG